MRSLLPTDVDLDDERLGVTDRRAFRVLRRLAAVILVEPGTVRRYAGPIG